jgi:adenine-specific DNA-methyltransferase
MPYFTDVDVAYEILLRQHDIPLSAKMEQLTKIGERTWCFADSYVVCLEEKITPKLVENLAAIEPTPFKYIFRDSAFGDDIVLKDETMRRLEANVKKNTGEKKKTYTVEFL